MSYVSEVLEGLKVKFAGQSEFLQAVEELIPIPMLFPTFIRIYLMKVFLQGKVFMT